MGIFKKCPCFCTGRRRRRSQSSLFIGSGGGGGGHHNTNAAGDNNNDYIGDDNDPSIIKELDYSHCCLEDVPATIFTYERTLEHLNLESNQIRDLPRVSFPEINSFKFICSIYRSIIISIQFIGSFSFFLLSFSFVHQSINQSIGIIPL